MLVPILFMMAGVALLYYGAETLVRGAATLAVRGNMSPLLVGLTVVAFGTSAPELVVSVQATLAGNGGIAVGNVVGSNICNIALILETATLVRPLQVDAQLVRLDIPLLIGVSVVLAIFLANETLSTVEGAALLAGVIAYVLFSIRVARHRVDGALVELEVEVKPEGSAGRDIVFVVIGLGLLVLGSHALVSGAVTIATSLGVSEAIIGLTIVALGTSLPELATSIMAAFKGEGELALGNVVGSSLFNALGILGVAALLRPLDSSGIGLADLGMMLAMAVLVLPLARTGYELSRPEGAFLLALYVGYVGFLTGVV